MDNKKEQALRELVGDDVATALFQQVEQKEGEAVVAGIRAKAKKDEAETEEKDAAETEAVETDEEAPKKPFGKKDDAEVEEKDEDDPEAQFDFERSVAELLIPMAERLDQLEGLIAQNETLEAEVKELQVAVKQMRMTVKELSGDLPKASAKARRASEGTDNVVSETEVKEKGLQPAPDPMSQFISSFLLKP